VVNSKAVMPVGGKNVLDLGFHEGTWAINWVKGGHSRL
jgi:hypothetical protein